MALAVRDAVLEPPMVSADILTPTNQPVTLSAVFPEESVVREYSFDGELWLAYESPIVMTENGTVYFRAADEFGMVSEVVCYEVANIDKIPPEQPVATANITDPTNGDVIVMGIFSGDSVVCEYSLNGTEWLSYESGITMHENGSVYFRSFDAAGNRSEIARYDVTNIDRIPPEAPVAAANPADPTNQNVLVTAEFASDAVVREFSLDGSSWSAYTDGVLMTDNGTVYFRSFDAAGNGSEVTEYAVTNIDRIPPEAPVAAADLTELTNQEVLVTAEFASDAAVREYSLDGSSWLVYADGVRMTENGTVYFRSFDAAGNVSETAEYTVGNIDRNPPVIIIQADNTEPDTEQSVFISASFADDIALLSQEYSLDGTVWSAYSSPIEMTKNGTVYFRAQDVAGNRTLEQFTVSNIAEGPESPEGTALSLKKYDLTFSWDKYAVTGGVKVQYQIMIDGVVDEKRISGTKYTLKNASVGEHSFAVRAVLTEKGQEEVLSRWSDELLQVVEDITAPETGKLAVDQISEDTVRLSWTPGEDNVGIVRYVLNCNGEVREFDGETFSAEFSGLSGKVTAEITACDEAGNTGKTVRTTWTMQDMTAPAQVTGLRSEGVDNKSGGVLAWEPSTDNVGVTEYRITVDDSMTYKSSRNSVKIGKLAAGVHFYTVVAVDKMKNESIVSDPVEFAVQDVIAPKTGKLYLEQTGEDTVRAEWTAASDDVGIARYVVTCGDGSVRELDGETLFTEFSGLSGKVTLEIVAYDEAGNAGNTVKKTLTMKDVTAPEQVTGLRSEGVDNKSGGILAWDPSTDNVGVTEYEIAIEGGKTYRSKTSSVKIGKMDAGTYKYTVTAFDKAKNESIISEEGEFTVADVIDPAIRKFSCKVTNQTLVVSWSAVDESSSIARSELWLDGLKYADTTGLDRFTLNGLELGQHSMELKVWDAAGNDASKTAKCTIKTADPAPVSMAAVDSVLCTADSSAKYGLLASV